MITSEIPRHLSYQLEAVRLLVSQLPKGGEKSEGSDLQWSGELLARLAVQLQLVLLLLVTMTAFPLLTPHQGGSLELTLLRVVSIAGDSSGAALTQLADLFSQ